MDRGTHSSDELQEELETAEEHLSEAEEILWVTASNVGPDKYAIQLEEMTQRLWDLQHELDDLRQDIDDITR
ncbi:hypothetical protein [Natranaeroarchaeum aerophilus]|uniref:Uncharacterized protein n=1 Tax=Natranaeroarchaeum aerophilus TaxID=2917711 RepID=A0AAE3FU16_9EURY|nr:hypothetical protein [Natranaeroarchaeum aerophilus]MCL9815191.1 hypothetical protein [Natranaeroarchaeum aerophilus]